MLSWCAHDSSVTIACATVYPSSWVNEMWQSFTWNSFINCRFYSPSNLINGFPFSLIKKIPCRSFTTLISLNTMSLLPIAFVIAYLTAHLEATYWICWFYCFRLSKWSSSSLWRIFCKNRSCDDRASMFFIRLFCTKSTPMPKIFIQLSKT